jgi:hypothetical protein
MNQPQHKATTREALREQYGFTKRTFARTLKRAGITHRRTVLTPKEVGQCYAYLVQEPFAGVNDANAPTQAN